jgi:STE24 endopeptidase
MPFDPATATAALLGTLPADEVARATRYTAGGHWLLLWDLVVSLAAAWLILRSGWLVRVRDRIERRGQRPVLVSLVIPICYSLAVFALSLPWSAYATWWREQSYGRTNQLLGDWLVQSAIGQLLFALFSALFFALLYGLIRHSPRRWWLWGTSLAGAAAAFALIVSPIVAEPIFNDYKALPRGPVRSALQALTAQAGVPDARLVSYDGSRQSNNFTANVSGLGTSARIAISDVALSRASLDEVRAVTGHELGHYMLGHVPRLVVTLSILILAGLLLVDRLFDRTAALVGASSVRGIADPAGLPIAMALFSILLLLATPVLRWTMRDGEMAADNYALRLTGDPDALARAVLKTAEFRAPYPSRLQEFLFYSHPSVERRVRNAMEFKHAQLARQTSARD